MKFFIAGIIQGSIEKKEIHRQNYRQEIKELILTKIPEADIYDPFENHQDSINYNDDDGRAVFLEHNRMCAEDIDVLIAYVPEASMGTAIEIWEAWKNGALVLTISPLDLNWAVRFLSNKIYPDLEAFKKSIENWTVQDGKLQIN